MPFLAIKTQCDSSLHPHRSTTTATNKDMKIPLTDVFLSPFTLVSLSPFSSFISPAVLADPYYSSNCGAKVNNIVDLTKIFTFFISLLLRAGVFTPK